MFFEKMSLTNGPLSYGPSRKCPLLSKCPFNRTEIPVDDNVNQVIFFILMDYVRVGEGESEGEGEGENEGEGEGEG
jgi:hypothetical protein